jgi:hypothetical protein
MGGAAAGNRALDGEELSEFSLDLAGAEAKVLGKRTGA